MVAFSVCAGRGPEEKIVAVGAELLREPRLFCHGWCAGRVADVFGDLSELSAVFVRDAAGRSKGAQG